MWLKEWDSLGNGASSKAKGSEKREAIASIHSSSFREMFGGQHGWTHSFGTYSPSCHEELSVCAALPAPKHTLTHTHTHTHTHTLGNGAPGSQTAHRPCNPERPVRAALKAQLVAPQTSIDHARRSAFLDYCTSSDLLDFLNMWLFPPPILEENNY